jgi:predicted transcriptional regulator
MTKVDNDMFIAAKYLLNLGNEQKTVAGLLQIGTTAMYYIAHSDTYEQYQRQMHNKKLDSSVDQREELAVALNEVFSELIKLTIALNRADAMLGNIYTKYTN